MLPPAGAKKISGLPAFGGTATEIDTSLLEVSRAGAGPSGGYRSEQLTGAALLARFTNAIAGVFVDLTSNQTIIGQKTFFTNPIVPAPGDDDHAVNRLYVTDLVAGAYTTISRPDLLAAIAAGNPPLPGRMYRITGTVLGAVQGVFAEPVSPSAGPFIMEAASVAGLAGLYRYDATADTGALVQPLTADQVLALGNADAPGASNPYLTATAVPASYIGDPANGNLYYGRAGGNSVSLGANVTRCVIGANCEGTIGDNCDSIVLGHFVAGAFTIGAGCVNVFVGDGCTGGIVLPANCAGLWLTACLGLVLPAVVQYRAYHANRLTEVLSGPGFLGAFDVGAGYAPNALVSEAGAIYAANNALSGTGAAFNPADWTRYYGPY